MDQNIKVVIVFIEIFVAKNLSQILKKQIIKLILKEKGGNFFVF